MLSCRRYFQLIFVIFVAHTQCADRSSQVEDLRVNKLIADYFQIEEHLWQVIERREENTLEQIYIEHKIRLGDSHRYENVIERNRIIVDPDLAHGLKFLNETTSMVAGILKSQDFGGLNRYAHSPRVRNITEGLELINRTISSTELWHDIRDDAETCKQHYTTNYQAEHQTAVEVYNDIQFACLRGYMTVQLAYMILGLREREKYRGESRRLHETFKENNKRFRQSILDVIGHTSRDVTSCSPDNYLFESNDFEMITGFLQGFVDNEINLNPEETCQRTCTDYQLTRQFGCHNDTFCAQPLKNTRINRCRGYVRDCEFIESDVEICPSIIDMKRYKYLKYENEKHFGAKGDCVQSIQAYSWTDWFVRCHNCFCLCDEADLASDRYFSLREVVSDIKANHIITGIHLAKPNRIIELVISERKLLGYGRLKPTNNYFHFNYPTWKRAHPKVKLNDPESRDGIDYHTLTYENRSINFDTVTVPQGYVVTGARFAMHNGHLRLEVRGTEFDFETGTMMNLENSTWYANENGGKHEIVLKRAKPIGLHGTPIVNTIPDSFIQFTPSDKEADAAQTIVPFLETAKVEPIQPVPLSGLGIYYKGKPGHGGVIAPKLVVYNFETLL